MQTAQAMTHRQTREPSHPDEDSVDRAAADLGELLDVNSTGEWDVVIASLPPAEPAP